MLTIKRNETKTTGVSQIYFSSTWLTKKNVNKSWAKSQNPNMFGGCPVVDNTGKIISVEIAAYGFIAEFFESKKIQTQRIEVFRRNNLESTGKKYEDLNDGIKKRTM